MVKNCKIQPRPYVVSNKTRYRFFLRKNLIDNQGFLSSIWKLGSVVFIFKVVETQIKNVGYVDYIFLFIFNTATLEFGWVRYLKSVFNNNFTSDFKPL